MPYKLESRDGQFCVIKKGGEVVKCHANRADALKHLAALKINVEDANSNSETVIPNEGLMLKELHDRLLELRPEDASHDESQCPFCNPDLETSEAHPTNPEGGLVKTYTEEEYAVLLKQVADLEAKVTELDGVRQESVVEAKVAEAKTELETQIADLQTQLDAAVNKAETAEKERDEIVTFLESVKTDEEAKVAFETTKAARIEKVKEVANFSDEYIAQRSDAWAKLDEEAFEAALADWAVIAKKDTSETIPTSTAMTAARTEPKSENGVLREVLGLRFKGIDTRTV